MTPVLIVYSALFARWAFVVKPQNLLLASCHITNVVAQGNQLRRAKQMGQKAALGGAVIVGSVLAGPTIRSTLSNANAGVVSTIAAADAGPFTVHFWAPMSKWLISGASFMDLHRPTDQISLPQYTALTLTGLFFSRYSLQCQYCVVWKFVLASQSQTGRRLLSFRSRRRGKEGLNTRLVYS
jgi:hypothetical protein